MEFATHSSPHQIGPQSVTRIMGLVLLALIPGTLALWWYFGWGVVVNITLATLTAVATEAIILRLRGRAAAPVLIDLSAVVTAWLLALALPPLLPWWQTVVGSAFAIIVAKQLFGGIGFNPFNPAMAGYVLLLVSFPVTMTRWLPPEVVSGNLLSLDQTLGIIFAGALPADLTWDAISSATPLDQMRSELSQNHMISEIRQGPLWGDFGGRGISNNDCDDQPTAIAVGGAVKARKDHIAISIAIVSVWAIVMIILLTIVVKTLPKLSTFSGVMSAMASTLITSPPDSSC